MAARSLRAHLLRMLLPPIAALLALGAIVAYYPSSEPTTEAYDQALVDIGIALGTHIQARGAEYRFELPGAVEQLLRTDRHDLIFYRVLGPDGVVELVIATNPTMSGEATALHLADLVRGRVRVTRLASGLPVGADLEHADELTLGRALLGRREL